MKRERIAISILGDFSSYKEAEYVIEPEGNGKTERTKYSVVSIARAKNVEKIILLIPLSVASAICPDLIRSGQIEKAKIELSESAKSVIESEMPASTKVEAYVLPNVGTFRISGSEKQIRLLGSPGVFHEAVYTAIYKILERIENFEIYIDVTHAVNSLILDAVDSIVNAARTVSATGRGKGKAVVYYSDPYVASSENIPLHIRVFKREMMENRLSSSSILLSGFIANFNANDYRVAIEKLSLPELNDPRALKEIAYHHSMGCVLMTSSLSDIMLKWRNGILAGLESIFIQPQNESINSEERIIEVNLPVKIERELSAAFSILEILTSDPFRRGQEPSLEDLKAMSKFIGESGSYLITDELDHIEKIAKEVGEKPTLLLDLLERTDGFYSRSTFSKNKSKVCKTNERNFIAHGGLERNVTCVIKKDGKIHLSYGSCLDEIKKSVRVFK